MQLEFPADFHASELPLTLQISERKGFFAVAKMFNTVWHTDRAAGDSTRILRKSAKRLFLHGRERFMAKLVHDYHVQEALHYEIGDPYAAWIGATETREFSDASSIKAAIARLPRRPLISILLPVRGNETGHLRKAVDSVLRQHYPHWELCISADATAMPVVHSIVGEVAAANTRVRTCEEPSGNGNLYNDAFLLACGDYVALLNPADCLADLALYFIAGAIAERPGVQCMYSDEDTLDENGVRSDPHFKCDWNPDLFMSQNCVSSLVTYRRDLVTRAGGFRGKFEGSEDYDLLLRCLPHLQADHIFHVPRVLYHRRRPFVGEGASGVDALRDHFASQGQHHVTVEPGLSPGTWRVRYPVPDPVPVVSLIIPTRDRLELLEPCVRSILNKTTYPNYEILILDNESREPETKAFFEHIQRNDKRVRVLAYHHAFNYSAINNYGVRQARGELIGLINNDIEVISPDWLTEMVSHACRSEIGCVGAKLYYDNDSIQHAGVILGLWGVAGHAHKHLARNASGYFNRAVCAQNFSAVTAACLLVRKRIYQQVGGLNETHLTVAFNDVDFCLKVREAGYRNLWTPFAELYHHESVSRGAEDTPEKKARERQEIEHMLAIWSAALARDPYYSPNLTHRREDFSINTDFERSALRESPPLRA